jgi:hypothetical protein
VVVGEESVQRERERERARERERERETLVIQLAVRMSRVTLSSVACLDVPYFSTLFHKLRDFRGEKVIEREMV